MVEAPFKQDLGDISGDEEKAFQVGEPHAEAQRWGHTGSIEGLGLAGRFWAAGS